MAKKIVAYLFYTLFLDPQLPLGVLAGILLAWLLTSWFPAS